MGVSGETSSDKKVDVAGQEDEEETDGPSGNGDGCSTICNIITKFTLFLTNFIIWVSTYKKYIICRLHGHHD